MFFSVVDVVGVLTESADYQLARNYWKVLKHRLTKEGFEPVTNCNQLKLVAKDCAEVARNARADIEHRLGHSVISSNKAIDHIKPKDELPFNKDEQ